MSPARGDSKASQAAGEGKAAAQAAGAVGRSQMRGEGLPSLTPAQKGLRDWAIIASVNAGQAVGEVAKEFDLTRRSVQRIMKAFRARPTGMESEAMQIFERVLRDYEQQMSDYARLAADTVERAPAVAVAAMKGHGETLERYVALMRSLGKLPSNLQIWRQEEEMRRISARMADKLVGLVEGTVVVQDVLEFFLELTRTHPPDFTAGADEVRDLSP